MEKSKLKVKFDALAPHLDERMRRMVAASETLSEGYGAISEVSRVTGVSRRAISQGLKELQEPIPGLQQKAAFVEKAGDENGLWILTPLSIQIWSI